MTTTRQALTDSWVNIGSGPLFLETPMLSSIAVHIGDTTPANDSDAYHGLHGPDHLSYEGDSQCYVRALNDTGVVIYTTSS